VIERRKSDVQIGAGLVFVGAAVLLISVFLPLADSSEFLHVAENSLIQHTEGWLVVALALAAAGAGYRTLVGEGKAGWIMAIGAIALGLAIFFGTSDNLLTLRSAEPTDQMGLGEALRAMTHTEKASPGIGIYAAGLGGLLVLAGGWMLRTPKAQQQPST